MDQMVQASWGFGQIKNQAPSALPEDFHTCLLSFQDVPSILLDCLLVKHQCVL